MSADRSMIVNVSVYEPEVVEARMLPTGAVTVVLGRADVGVRSSEVTLFVDAAETAGFVRDLVDAVEKVRPGFWVELTSGWDAPA